MPEREIVPWFGGSPITVQSIEGSDRIAYSWGRFASQPEDAPLTIRNLLLWHDCTQSVGKADADRPGWAPWGAGLHTLVAVEPLHIEASVFYPACCGMHGFIRAGRWVPA